MPETIEEDEKDLGHGSLAEEVQKEEISQVKSPARRGRKPKTETSETKPKEVEEDSAEKKQRGSVGTPSLERPARERKAVERYAALSPRRVTPSKIPPIEQGPGTKLRDIPNVSFKLSKRKVDENLQALHTILFGRKANAHYLKRNISQFSGFVWTSDEEKQKTKVKEKLDKCNKDRLLDFCELLDVCTVKGTTKKEEISVKLMEFLESPHVSRDVVLAEKEKAKKRKRRRKGFTEIVPGEASSDGDDKTEGKKELTQSAKSEKDDDSVSSEAKDEPADVHNSDSDDNTQRGDEETQEDSALNEKKQKPGDSVKTKEKSSLGKKGHTKSAKDSFKSSSKDRSKASDEQKESSSKGATPRPLKKKRKAAADEDSIEAPADSNDTDPPASKPKVERKSKGQQKKNKKGEEQMAATAKRPVSGSSVSSKGKVKAKASSGEDGGPTKEELREVVSEILKEVDFSTATLADILRQLGDHFSKNLMDRKAEVKAIIEEVISNMSDDEEVDEGDDEEGAEGEGSDGEDDG